MIETLMHGSCQYSAYGGGMGWIEVESGSLSVEQGTFAREAGLVGSGFPNAVWRI